MSLISYTLLLMGRELGVGREWKGKRITFYVPFYPPDCFYISIMYGLCENMRMNICPDINFCCNQDSDKLYDV